MMSIRFVTPGLSSPRRTSLPESVTAERTFLRIVSGGSSISSVPCGVPARRRHLPGRLLQVHDPRAHLGVVARAAP